jgi:hypothetical protein
MQKCKSITVTGITVERALKQPSEISRTDEVMQIDRREMQSENKPEMKTEILGSLSNARLTSWRKEYCRDEESQGRVSTDDGMQTNFGERDLSEPC